MPRPESPSRRAARWLAADPRRTMAQAVERFAVTRQAVYQAKARLESPGKIGRPKSDAPRGHWIATDHGNLRVSAVELRAFRRAANRARQPLAAWLRGVAGEVEASAARKLARKAAGLPEE